MLKQTTQKENLLIHWLVSCIASHTSWFTKIQDFMSIYQLSTEDRFLCVTCPQCQTPQPHPGLGMHHPSVSDNRANLIMLTTSLLTQRKDYFSICTLNKCIDANGPLVPSECSLLSAHGLTDSAFNFPFNKRKDRNFCYWLAMIEK